MTDQQRANYISALIREREGYMRSGDEARAAEVSEELRKIGAEGDAPAKRATTRPSRRKTESR